MGHLNVHHVSILPREEVLLRIQDSHYSHNRLSQRHPRNHRTQHQQTVIKTPWCPQKQPKSSHFTCKRMLLCSAWLETPQGQFGKISFDFFSHFISCCFLIKMCKPGACYTALTGAHRGDISHASGSILIWQPGIFYVHLMGWCEAVIDGWMTVIDIQCILFMSDTIWTVQVL